MTLGEKIQELRKRNYMSQEELADRVEVSKQSVSKWELDKAIPNVEKIARLCDVFQIGADYLIRENMELPAVGTGVAMTSEQIEEKKQQNLQIYLELERERQDAKELQIFKRRLCKGLLSIGVVLTLSFLMLLIYVGINTFGIRENAKQEMVIVDRVYNQYTKADVLYYDEAQRFVTKTVFLDINGVSEGDYVFAYVNAENPSWILFPYRQDTFWLLSAGLILSLVASSISVILLQKGSKGSVTEDDKVDLLKEQKQEDEEKQMRNEKEEANEGENK